MAREQRQFGLWSSEVSPGAIASETRLSSAQWDTDGQTLVWLEGRSDRGVLVAKYRDESPRDLTSELNVRAEVGYGFARGLWVQRNYI